MLNFENAAYNILMLSALRIHFLLLCVEQTYYVRFILKLNFPLCFIFQTSPLYPFPECIWIDIDLFHQQF